MNLSAALAALVPLDVVTVISTVPVPAGEVAVIEVAEFTVKALAALEPKCTLVASERFSPAIDTLAPGDILRPWRLPPHDSIRRPHWLRVPRSATLR